MFCLSLEHIHKIESSGNRHSWSITNGRVSLSLYADKSVPDFHRESNNTESLTGDFLAGVPCLEGIKEKEKVSGL